MAAPFSLGEEVIETRVGPRGAVVVTPTRTVNLGADRIDGLRDEPSIGEIDRQIISRAAARDDLELLVFRARSDDGSCWGFDQALQDSEVSELGYLLVRAQTPVYRRLMAAGMMLTVHVEWGEREMDAFRAGIERRVEELALTAASATGDEAAVAAVDRWILRHLTFYFGVSFRKAVRSVLPDKIPLIERRVPKMREMVEALPANALS